MVTIREEFPALPIGNDTRVTVDGRVGVITGHDLSTVDSIPGYVTKYYVTPEDGGDVIEVTSKFEHGDAAFSLSVIPIPYGS